MMIRRPDVLLKLAGIFLALNKEEDSIDSGDQEDPSQENPIMVSSPSTPLAITSRSFIINGASDVSQTKEPKLEGANLN